MQIYYFISKCLVFLLLEMISTLVDWIYFIFGLHSFILLLTGTPLNLLCFYVFKRLIPNRSNATIIVFSYLSLVELLIPFAWNFNYAVRELILKRRTIVTIKNLEQHSLAVCKLISFGAYFFLQSAAWLKTFATFARCVSLHPQWSIRKYFLQSSIIHRLSWSIIFFFGLINSPILFINGRRVDILDQFNQTKIQIKCYQSKYFQFWEIVHLLLYNFLPFTLMILCNISIIRCVDQSHHRTKHSKLRSTSIVAKRMSTTSGMITRRAISSSGSRLTKTLLSITIFFIVFTSPAAIYYISLDKYIKRHRNLITMGLSNLATTNHVLSFVIYWITSSDFQHAVMNFFTTRICSILFRQTIEERFHDIRIDVIHSPETMTVTENHPEPIERKLPSFQ